MTNPPSLEWHEGYGPGTNIWFAHRYCYSGNCAAVDLKPGGWQYLIFDRNGTNWYVRRPGFYPTREEAMAAAVVELEAQS